MRRRTRSCTCLPPPLQITNANAIRDSETVGRENEALIHAIEEKSAYVIVLRRLCCWCCRGRFSHPQSRTPPRGSATISRRPRATHDLIRGGAGRPGRRHSSGRYSSGVRPPRRERVPRGPGIHIAKRNDPPPPCSRVRRAGPSAPVRRPASPGAPAHPGPRPRPGARPGRNVRRRIARRGAGYNATPAAAKKWIKRRRGHVVGANPTSTAYAHAYVVASVVLTFTHSIWTMRPDPCVLLL